MLLEGFSQRLIRMNRKKIKVDTLSTKTQGIKSEDGTWYNLSNNSDFSEDQMKKFLKNNIDNGDEIFLHIDDDGYYHKISFDKSGSSGGYGKDFRKGSEHDSNSDKIMKQVALKSSVEFQKSLSDDTSQQDVVSVAQTFYDWLRDGN